MQEFDKIQPLNVYDKVVSLYGPVDRKMVDPDYEEPLIVSAPPKTVDPVKPKDISKPKTKTMEVPKRDISPRARVQRHPVGREYVVVNQGETLSQLAKTYETDVDKLMKYNDLSRAEELRANQYLFFNKKKNRGAKKFYTVEKGDNLYLISQKNGIKLDQLLRRNRIDESYKPSVGEVLYLRGRKPKN